jgi:hypothetical protein
MEPWEHESYNVTKESRSRYVRGETYAIRTTYKTIEDHDGLFVRKGDIIRFGNGYNERPFGDWKDWFLTREQKKLFWTRHPKIPYYASNQYAVVVNRYKWIKYKRFGIFRDYGYITMFITGNKPCRIKKFYGTSPFRTVSCFPHLSHIDGGIHADIKKPFSVVDGTWFLFDFNLSEFIQNLLDKYEETELSRDLFLKKLKEVWEANI